MHWRGFMSKLLSSWRDSRLQVSIHRTHRPRFFLTLRVGFKAIGLMMYVNFRSPFLWTAADRLCPHFSVGAVLLVQPIGQLAKYLGIAAIASSMSAFISSVALVNRYHDAPEYTAAEAVRVLTRVPVLRLILTCCVLCRSMPLATCNIPSTISTRSRSRIAPPRLSSSGPPSSSPPKYSAWSSKFQAFPCVSPSLLSLEHWPSSSRSGSPSIRLENCPHGFAEIVVIVALYRLSS